MIVERDFLDHPKTVRLARALGSDAPLLMIRIWGHCEARRSPSLGQEAEDIASICRWPGDAQQLVRALLASAYIVQTPDGFLAHGWAEKNARFLAQVKAGHERAAKAHRLANGKLAATSQLAGTQHAGQLPSQHAGAKSDAHQPPLSFRAASTPASTPASTQLPTSVASPVEWSGVENPPIVPQGGQEDASALALEDTRAFLCGLFGRKKNRLSSEAERELSGFAASLPFTEAQKKLIAWFMAIPASDPDAPRRPESADACAKAPFSLLERAEAHAKKTGGLAQKKPAEKNRAAAEPDAWRQWFAATYPEHPCPATWHAVPQSLRSAFALSKK